MQNTKPIVEKSLMVIRGGNVEAKDTQLWARMVLVKFPNKASAEEFYESEEYKPFKEVRHRNAFNNDI